MSRARKTARRRRWLRWVLVGIAVILALPVLQVGCVRVVNPPVTSLMLLRTAEGWMKEAGAPERQYRWMPLNEMPQDFLKSVLFAEDQRFFQHRGFDWKEIHAARAEAARRGRAPRGASTITMQCARSLFLWPGRSWLRKGMEAYYTFWMELLLPKRRILELYGNVVEMGGGIYGVSAAARAHYGVEPAQLTKSECALLAALLPNPRKWDPRRPGPQLADRRARILRHAGKMRFPPEFWSR